MIDPSRVYCGALGGGLTPQEREPDAPNGIGAGDDHLGGCEC
jgi:hypothetical protein